MADFGYSPQEGVTFYYDNRGKVTDLCINPNVKTVTICSRSSNSFVGSQFSLQDCKKQFPDVEVLRISSDIIDVCINNKMFPNVKNVYSESKYYKNDVRMLVHKYKNGSFALKNAFCAAAGDVIDLKGISIIDDNAFDGCMATDFVNIDDVSICRADAFTGSAIELNKRYKNGLQIFGSVLIGVQSGVCDIEIPSYVKYIKKDISFQDVKNVTINNADQLCFFNDVSLDCLQLNGCNILPGALRSKCNVVKVKQYKICNSSIYCDVGGVIFTEDRKILISYPKLREGHYDIPDGTETIWADAFSDGLISSVKIADSVYDIGDRAFSGCKHLENIEFGKGITNYSHYGRTRTFSYCTSLKSVTIPEWVKSLSSGMFVGCRLESLTLPDGLEEIETNAFGKIAFEDITIPPSVKVIYSGNFTNSKTYRFTDRVPHGFIGGLLYNGTNDPESLQFSDLVKKFIITEGGKEHVLFLPAYLEHKTAYELDEILSNFSCTIKDEQYYLDCYKSCPDLILVQETAIALALITGNENIKKELKKRARSITSRLLKSNQEEKLVDFLKLDLLSDRMLASLQETAQENGMTTVSAYILNEQNKKLLKKESSKSTFRIEQSTPGILSSAGCFSFLSGIRHI